MAQARLVLLAALLTVTVAAAQTSGDPLTIVWTAEGTLYRWGDGTAQVLAENNATRPYLSPDGGTVAYTTGDAGLPQALWAQATDLAGEPRLLVTPEQIAGGFLDQVAWFGGEQLCFNTSQPNVPFGVVPQDDLWCVDMGTGMLNNTLPAGKGGAFDVSPADDRAALVRPGTFDADGQPAQDGDVRVLQADGTTQVLHTFTPLPGGSHAGTYPRVYWMPDTTALLTAIPATTPDASIVYALWRVPIAGAATQMGTVDVGQGVFIGWSAGREHVAYASAAPGVEGAALTLAATDGTDAQVIAGDVRGTFAWAQQGNAFALTRSADVNTVEVGRPTEIELAPITVADVDGITRIRLLDADTLVYTGASGTDSVLGYVTDITGTPQITELFRVAGNPVILFDVRR